MEQKPAMTNTKAEILAAYNDLFKKKEAENSKHPKKKKQKNKKKKL